MKLSDVKQVTSSSQVDLVLPDDNTGLQNICIDIILVFIKNKLLFLSTSSPYKLALYPQHDLSYNSGVGTLESGANIADNVTETKDSSSLPPKETPKKKRKSAVEKSLEIAFEKFKEASNEDFARYSTYYPGGVYVIVQYFLLGSIISFFCSKHVMNLK